MFAKAAVSHLEALQPLSPTQHDDVRQRPKRDWTETIDKFTSTTIDWKQTTGPSRARATTMPPKIKILKEDLMETGMGLTALQCKYRETFVGLMAPRGEALCQRRVHHIMARGVADDMLGTYFNPRGYKMHIIAGDINKAIKLAVTSLSLEKKGFPPSAVSSHSLVRAGGGGGGGGGNGNTPQRC